MHIISQLNSSENVSFISPIKYNFTFWAFSVIFCSSYNIPVPFDEIYKSGGGSYGSWIYSTYAISAYPVSSTNKTDRYDITEILLKVTLNTIKQTNKQTNKQTKVVINVQGAYIIHGRVYRIITMATTHRHGIPCPLCGLRPVTNIVFLVFFQKFRMYDVCAIRGHLCIRL